MVEWDGIRKCRAAYKVYLWAGPRHLGGVDIRGQSGCKGVA